MLVFASLALLAASAALPPRACRGSPTALAFYCPATDNIHLNKAAIRRDYHCGLCYFRRPSTPTGKQKQAVFAMHDPDGAQLRRWLAIQPDPPEAYVEFVRQHELGHQRLHRHADHSHPLMHPETLHRELEANLYAYESLGIR